MRRGTLRRCVTAVAATASGGDTIAPSTNATGQLIPGITACATQATAVVVTTTRPTASNVIGRRVGGEVTPRREPRRREQQRRQEQQQHQLGIDLHRRQPRHERQPEAAQDQQDRVGDLQPFGGDGQRRRDDEEDENELERVHGDAIYISDDDSGGDELRIRASR